MKEEQQRIKIAEACGWTAEQNSNGYWRAVNKKHGNAVELWLSEQNVWSLGIPDYLNDLNAMHEAINTLDQIQMMEFYNNHIYDVVCNNRTSYSGMDHANVCNATAAQRAEAFLKTLGLWEEEA